jgi:hypothetical protein
MINLIFSNMSFSFFRSFRLYGIVALAILLAPVHAFALPKVCGANGGRTWAFSIGRTVFELTNLDPTILASEAHNVDPSEWLVPPNPAMPVGCKDNPQQLSYFRPKGWPRLQPTGYTGEMPVGAHSLQLIRFPPPDGDDPKVDIILFLREESALDCENRKYLKRYDDGTILCTDQPGDQNSRLISSVDRLHSEWEFIISAKRYSTPLGDNLAVDNGPLGPSATYLLTSDVLLNYSWSVIGRNAPIEPTDVIRVDQSIISALEAYEIDDYPWPNQIPVKSAK